MATYAVEAFCRRGSFSVNAARGDDRVLVLIPPEMAVPRVQGSTPLGTVRRPGTALGISDRPPTFAPLRTPPAILISAGPFYPGDQVSAPPRCCQLHSGANAVVANVIRFSRSIVSTVVLYL